jgi:hypothetical protein
LAVQRRIILDENQYIRTVLLFTRLRITLLTTSHLLVLAKGARKIEELTASKIFQIRHDASEAKFHENVDFAAVKRSFWMKNGSRGPAGKVPFWPWDGLSCRPGGTSGCHEFMGIGEKCVHKYLNAVFQSRVMLGIAKICKMWFSLQ